MTLANAERLKRRLAKIEERQQRGVVLCARRAVLDGGDLEDRRLAWQGKIYKFDDALAEKCKEAGVKIVLPVPLKAPPRLPSRDVNAPLSPPEQTGNVCPPDPAPAPTPAPTRPPQFYSYKDKLLLEEALANARYTSSPKVI